MSDWTATCQQQLAQLNLIADWAAITNLGIVRDHVRYAASELRKHIEWREEQEALVKKEREATP